MSLFLATDLQGTRALRKAQTWFGSAEPAQKALRSPASRPLPAVAFAITHKGRCDMQKSA